MIHFCLLLFRHVSSLILFHHEMCFIISLYCFKPVFPKIGIARTFGSRRQLVPGHYHRGLPGHLASIQQNSPSKLAAQIVLSLGNFCAFLIYFYDFLWFSMIFCAQIATKSTQFLSGFRRRHHICFDHPANCQLPTAPSIDVHWLSQLWGGHPACCAMTCDDFRDTRHATTVQQHPIHGS